MTTVIFTQYGHCTYNGALCRNVDDHAELFSMLTRCYYSVALLRPLLSLGDIIKLGPTPELTAAVGASEPIIGRPVHPSTMGEHTYELWDNGFKSTWIWYQWGFLHRHVSRLNESDASP